MLGKRSLPSNLDVDQSSLANITELHTYPIEHSYLKKLFKWIGLWALCVIAFIWIVDPYGVSPIRISLHRFNAYKPKRLDIDRIIKPYEVWRYQPKTIFIGTSRIHQSIDPSTLDGTTFAPAYNAAIPASTLAENADHIEQFLKLDHNIEHIFIELFLYNFTGQGQEPHPETIKQFLSNITSLQISSDALIDAIKTVNVNRKGGPAPAYIAKLGYRVPGSDFNPADTFSDAFFMRNVLSWNQAGKLQLNPEAFQSLDRIVKIARNHHIKLHFLLTPNYPWDDSRLMTLGYWPLLEEWMQKIATYPDVVSFSQYNNITQEPIKHDPKMKWWNDPTHFSLNTGRMMMNAYLGHPMPGTPHNFLRQINPKTINSIITERRDGAKKWSAAHPDFVTDFEEAKAFSDTITGTLDIESKILAVNRRKYHISLGVGEILMAINNSGTVTANGWSVDEVATRHPSRVIATIGNSVVAQGIVYARRPDIEAALGKHPVTSGFNIDIPLQTWDKSKPIRVFALMKNGRAVQLTTQIDFFDGAPFATALGTLKSNKIMIDDKTYPVINRIAGFVEQATPIYQGYSIKGWVTKNNINGQVVSVIAAINGHILAKSLLTVKRDEKISTKPSGFTINLLFKPNQLGTHFKVHFFALTTNGVALPIRSNIYIASALGRD